MEKLDYKDEKGWAVDADTENDPTYPIKHRTDEENDTWIRPPQQPETVEVLQSIERPNITAVFGTSVPPSGLSGAIRRFAFKYGEGSYAHWLPLLLADRINVVEGIVEDLKRGYVPNIFAERGIKAEWKFNKKAVIKKTAIGVAISAVAYILIKRSGRK